MSGLRRELRPYLVIWPVIWRLTLGTWALLCGLGRACLAGEGSDKLWRALGALAVGVFAWRIVVRAPVVELLLLAVWAVLAWRAGPAPKDEPEPEEERGENQEEQQPEAPEEGPAGPPLPTREQLVAALHQVADPHAQTVPLAAHLGTTHVRVREALKEAGIPLTDGVRMKGRSSAAGVRKDHIPPLPSPAPGPYPAVVGAGQRPAPTTTTGAVVERPHKGMTIIRYPAEDARRRHIIRRGTNS